METMRERVLKTLGEGSQSLAIRELAEAHDAMALRLAALERGATVDARGVPFIRPELAAKAAAWREAQPNTSGDTAPPPRQHPAPGTVVWPAGSCPPPGAGQVRSEGFVSFRISSHDIDHEYPYVCDWSDGGRTRRTALGLQRAPLAEPWTEPADGTPADPRIAALEARVAALTAERDAAVKRAEEAEGARVERVAVDTTHIPNPVAPGSVVCPNCERDITLSAHAGASEGA